MILARRIVMIARIGHLFFWEKVMLAPTAERLINSRSNAELSLLVRLEYHFLRLNSNLKLMLLYGVFQDSTSTNRSVNSYIYSST